MLRTQIHRIALTRSHLCFPQSFRLAKFKSVDLKRRPPKSLPWPPRFRRRRTFSVRGSGPQGLRRPRFSFFRFTCQTARNRDGSVVPTPAPKGSGAGDARTSDMAIAHGRMIHRINSEGLRGRAIAPRGGASKRPYIGFSPRYCQPFNMQKCALRKAQANTGPDISSDLVDSVFSQLQNRRLSTFSIVADEAASSAEAKPIPVDP
jgi:hypothetical protein